MVCPCGKHFNWDQASVINPCRHPHPRDESFFVGNCRQCSMAAKVERGLYNTGFTLLVGAPLVAVAGSLLVGGAATVTALALPVALTPAVIFTPAALAYETCSAVQRIYYSSVRACNSLGASRTAGAPSRTTRQSRGRAMSFGSPSRSLETAARRRQHRKRNPFIPAATSGARVVGGAMVVAFICVNGYDSD